jgi:hypothetical protein
MVQALVLTLALVGVASLLSSLTGSRWPLALLMAGLLGRGVLRMDWYADIVRPYTFIRPRHLLVGLLALTLPITAYVLTADLPVLGWSLLSVVGQETGNVASAGLEVGIAFAIPYLLLLLAALPMLALIEEYWFRRGTRGWLDGLWRSLLFGLAHTLVGVPLGVAVCGLGAVGLLFTAVYLRAERRPAAGEEPAPAFAVSRFPSASPPQRRGMDSSALQHLAYNTLALALAVVGMVLSAWPEIV